VPVVASRAGGIPEVVVDGVTGLLASVGDVPAFAAQVERLLADDGLHALMSIASRARACEAFAVDSVLDRYEAIYRAASEE